MKFLLFFVSLIFTFIFYIFHWLTIWKDIFWSKISNSYDIVSFSWNLLIESFIFFLIGISFLYLFSDLKDKWTNKLQTHKVEILYFIFYIIFLYYIYFIQQNLNNLLLIIIIFFISSDLIFNHLSNIKSLKYQKINLKYFGLIINYFSSVLGVIYIYISWFSFLIFLILLFNIFFNLFIHKKYTNYISLIISILIILFWFYLLYFSLFKLYILYI